jgi:dihydroxyacetone kinase
MRSANGARTDHHKENRVKKIINQPDDFVDEVIDALLLAHPGWIKAATADRRALVRADAPKAGHVGIVTGGGSGHMPGFLGYVGEGLCSGVAVGNVFSSPSAQQIFEATKAVNGGAGVLYVYGNYGGDVFNFDLAADLAEPEGIDIKTVLLTDDVASAPAERASDRRGVAGMAFVFKCAGAAAERGDSLDEVARICAKANDHCRTMGVGLSPTILPAAGKPTFTLPDGEMEIGIGIHGEPGTHRGKLESADAIADRLMGQILGDLQAPKGSRLAVLINGLGATPLEELYLLFRRAAKVIGDHGLSIARSYVGEYVTSLEMAGASITVMLLDDELEALLAAPARSPLYRDWLLV